jgi:hypothetical protein
MYYWYKIAFFDETPDNKYEAETNPMDYIFFQIFKINPLCVVLNHNEPGPKAQCHMEKG